MITSGSTVRKKGETVHGIVVSTKESFAEVNIENENRWLEISDLEEISDELINRILGEDFDDEIDFILGIDAHRLLTEYRFNPYVLASSTKIQIYPHQIDEVIWALDNSKIMIADEVGLGKTIIAALIASEWKARGLVRKSLFVVPKSLVLKWKDELETRFEYDVEILDSEYIKIHSEPFERDKFTYIASMDFLKQDHIKEKIKNGLDIVVIDEAHKLKLKSSGGRTNRLKLGDHLTAHTNILIFLTATPHDGRDDDFMARINLLDPYAGDVLSSNYLWTRTIKEDVTDIDGEHIFPDRESKTVDIWLTNQEREINYMLKKYFENRREEAYTRQEMQAVTFLEYIFRKRSSSSISALKNSLERRLLKLDDKVQDIGHTTKIQSELDNQEDELDSEYEGDITDIISFTLTKDIEKEKRDLASIISEIEKLNTKDTKFDMLLKSIKESKKGDEKTKIVLFTEYRDTLRYLIDRLSEHYSVGRIDGTMNISDRQDTLLRFRKDDGPEILICTDAAGEGIDMQFCNIEFNYDLPWNPNKLEQRMGRIHRIGQTRDVYYYNFVVDRKESIDGYILGRLLEKIENIKNTMGGKIYDIIGSILSVRDISKYYEELRKAPQAHWESKLSELLDKDIEENKNRIIKYSDQLLEGHRFDRQKMENISKIKKEAVDIGEIRRFLHLYVESNEGKFELINKTKEYYKIYPPSKIMHELNIGIIEGTFSQTLAHETGGRYIALGDREINKIISNATNKVVASLTHPQRSGTLFVYKISITDGKGKTRNSKIISYFCNDDGKVTEIDPRSIWDYTKSDKNKTTSFVINSKKLVDVKLYEKIRTYQQKTQEKLDNIKDKTEHATRKFFGNKIEHASSKIEDYTQRLSEDPEMEKLITRERNNKKKYGAELAERLSTINKEYVTTPVIDLIAIALVSPEHDHSAKRQTELAGMDAVLKYERNRAKSDEQRNMIKDVSEMDPGYDIESFDRKIEVKSFSTTGDPKLTSHEWETADRLREDYWLYVVKDTSTEPQIGKIQNPFVICKNSIDTVEVTEFRYMIKDWEQFVIRD